MTRDGSRVRGDHNRVEPGDAIGMSIRVPVERFEVLVDLLAPGVPPELVLSQRDYITVYPTIGRDTLNGRPVAHRWANLITDPPAGVPADDAIGGIACVGAPSSPISRMWWRQGLGRVPGRVWLAVDRDPLRAHARIATAGATLRAEAVFDSAGEPWTALPQHFHILTSEPPRMVTGDEWGTRHDGSGRVVVDGPDGRVEFDAYVGLDVDLGWDYMMGPHLSPAG
jgi:hypothetical protein